MSSGAEARLGHQRILGTYALRLNLCRQIVVTVIVGDVLIEGVADDDVASGVIDVARESPQRIQRLRSRDAHDRLIDRKAPLHGSILGTRVHACSSNNVRFVNPAYFSGASRRPFLDALGQFIEAIAPFLNKVMIVDILLYHDIEHGHRQSSIGARSQAQPDFRTRSEPGQGRVDGNHLGAALHAINDPSAVEVIGV